MSEAEQVLLAMHNNLLTTLQKINHASARIQLSALSEQDQNLYCAVMTTNGSMQYVAAALSIDTARQSFATALKLNRHLAVSRFYFRVSLIDSGIGIGIASINELDIIKRSADIGRMLLPEWQGKGLGTELSQLLIKVLHSELAIMHYTKHIRHDNTAAIASAQKLGFQQINHAESTSNRYMHCYYWGINQPMLAE